MFDCGQRESFLNIRQSNVKMLVRTQKGDEFELPNSRNSLKHIDEAFLHEDGSKNRSSLHTSFEGRAACEHRHIIVDQCLRVLSLSLQAQGSRQQSSREYNFGAVGGFAMRVTWSFCGDVHTNPTFAHRGHSFGLHHRQISLTASKFNIQQWPLPRQFCRAATLIWTS